MLVQRLVTRKARRKSNKLITASPTSESPLTTLTRPKIWAVARSFRKDNRFIRLFNEFKPKCRNVNGELGNKLRTSAGTRQGDGVSPTTFTIRLQWMMDKVKEMVRGV
jgi:hypothetical protein